MVARPLAERFWPKVRKTRSCWLWTASVDVHGYGQIGGISADGHRTMFKAHRVSWQLHRGPIPVGMCVLHKCDRPRCVRPAHLFIGTVADNVMDMTAKGRNVFQYRNPSKKLSDRQVRELRRRRAEGERLKALADVFGVRESTVSRIANGVRR